MPRRQKRYNQRQSGGLNLEHMGTLMEKAAGATQALEGRERKTRQDKQGGARYQRPCGSAARQPSLSGQAGESHRRGLGREYTGLW